MQETKVNSSLFSKFKKTQVNSIQKLPDITGLTIDKFHVDSRLDIVSGEADIYLCSRVNDKSGKNFLLKYYRREKAVKPDVIEKLKTVNSPYVAKIEGFGEFEGYQYVVRPYYEMSALSELLAEGTRFSEEELKTLIIPSIIEGLKVVHDAGILHKDLKPANLIPDDAGEHIVLIDFGISTDTGKNTIVVTQTSMTPFYAAPEAMQGIFHRETDYYALGITVFELFTGFTPFQNPELTGEEAAKLASVSKIEFPDNFPESLKKLVLGLTYKDISHRNEKNNPNRRWGYDEVKGWLKNADVPVPGGDFGRIHFMSKTTKLIVFLTVLFLLFVFSYGGGMLSSLRNDSKLDVAQTSSVKEENVKQTSPSFHKDEVKVDSSSSSLKSVIKKENVKPTSPSFHKDEVKVDSSSSSRKSVIKKENVKPTSPSFHKDKVKVDSSSSSLKSEAKVENVEPISPSLTTKVDAPTKIETSSNSSLKGVVKVGNVVTFGRYYNTNDRVLEPLRWRVLSVVGTKALLITENCIDAMYYHHKDVNVDWEHSDIRKWLNSDFIDMAFSSSEQKKLQVTNNINNAGARTRDTVFLLNISEAKKYFHSREDRACKVTKYAKSKGTLVYPEDTMYGWWWLRSRSYSVSNSSYVDGGGFISTLGGSMLSTHTSVRPALWISIKP